MISTQLPLPRFLLAALSMFLLAAIVGGALGVVWLRQSIATEARTIIKIEKSIVEAQRALAMHEARIAKIHDPQFLKEKLNQRLVRPKKYQVVWMDMPSGVTQRSHQLAMLDREMEGSRL